METPSKVIKIMSNNYQPVPHKEYDKEYFLTDCAGYTNFIESLGLKIDERISKSLKLANIEPNMNVLDVGSGRGEIVLHCALRKSIAIGIDYSFDAVKLAVGLKKKYKTIGNKMFFLRGSATKLPFKNNVFDRIFLLDLIEHLHEHEIDNLFQDLNNILKDNGILIIHTAPNKLYYEYGYKIIRVILYILKGIRIEKDIRSNYEKKMHVNEQTSRYLYKSLKRNGFDSKLRLYDISYSDFLIKKHLPQHPLSTTILSIINRTFLAQIFCRDIYAVAWKYSQSNPNYTNIFNELGKIHETEYIPYSKDDVIGDIVTDCIVMGKNEIGVIGNGWHHAENWPPAIRWTEKNVTAYLKADTNCKKLFIKAVTYHPPIKGQILIEKEQVQKFDMQDLDWKLLEVDIPDFCKNRIIEITIELNNTWIPNEVIKNGDTRELGIAVHKIWLE